MCTASLRWDDTRFNRIQYRHENLITILLLFPALGFAQTYDIVLQGGHVIDPKNNINGVMDVAVRGGKVTAVGANLGGGKTTIDVKGLYVTPGLIDLHTHVYFTAGNPESWAGDNSVQPDAFSFRTGVTTMVDAGTPAGAT